LFGCGQFNDHGMGPNQIYSLCPTTEGSHERLIGQVREFAEQQDARLTDRSAGVQQELSDIGSSILNDTGRAPVLMTVEKPDVFRVAVTNLGLRTKFVLSVRFWNEAEGAGPVDAFMAEIEEFWAIEAVEGGVLDNPPC
jgi:hypothetical protein